MTVAEHEPGPPRAEVDHVVPVATDLGARDPRVVVGGDVELLGVERALGHQALLELVGDPPLAVRRFTLRARLGERALGGALLGDVLTLPRSRFGSPCSSTVDLAAGVVHPRPERGRDEAHVDFEGPAREAGLDRRQHVLEVVGMHALDGLVEPARAQLLERHVDLPQVLRRRGHLVRGEIDLPAADAREPLRLVEQVTAAAQRVAGAAGAVELQVGVHAREQLAGRERLDQVVVGARLQALDRALLAGARGDHDHGDVRRGRVGLRARRATRSRPGWASSRRSRRAPAARRRASWSATAPSGRGLHGVAAVEQRRDVRAHVRVVVDDEHARALAAERATSSPTSSGASQRIASATKLRRSARPPCARTAA